MIVTIEHIADLIRKGEGSRIEMKACGNSLPKSVWETYSAFANTRGGEILLGITEHMERIGNDRFEITGVDDPNKIVTDFFNILHNRQKVNRSVLVDSDVRIVDINGRNVVHIYVPEADYRLKPIYINDNIQSGTYKRLNDGDRHVSADELAMMIRDSTDNADQQIIENYGMDDIDPETLRQYRQAFISINPGHAYAYLPDKDFLIKLGGYAVDRRHNREGLTMAGLLMCGKSIAIHDNFPRFRVDYLDLIGIEPGDNKKWNDRLTDDGRWEDNIYNFLLLCLRKLLFTLPSEGKLIGVLRNDGGPLHEAVREAIINCITYCDYKLGGVMRIDRRTDRIVMRNPGSLRISPERIYSGDYTQARNSTIQKMLRMTGFGDNIGSGFQKILRAWNTLGFAAPEIRQEEQVNEVWLTLPLTNALTLQESKDKHAYNHLSAQTDVSAHLSAQTNVSAHLSAQQLTILSLIESNNNISIPEIASRLGVSEGLIRSQRRAMSKYVELKRIGSRKAGHWEIVYKTSAN